MLFFLIGHIFVCGDNHSKSLDSFTWGPIPVERILGIMVLKFSRKKEKSFSVFPSQGYSLFSGDDLMISEDAPMFTAQSLKGEIITRDTFANQPVILIFFAPTHHCIDILKQCMALAPHGKVNGFALICVSSTSAETTAAFIRKLHIHLPILIAPRSSNSFFADYKIHMTPAYCVLDASSKILSRGQLFRDDFENKVLSLIEEHRLE